MKPLAEFNANKYPAIAAHVAELVALNKEMKVFEKTTKRKILEGQDRYEKIWESIHKECVKEKLLPETLPYADVVLEVNHETGEMTATKNDEQHLKVNKKIIQGLIDMGRAVGVPVPKEVLDMVSGDQTVH